MNTTIQLKMTVYTALFIALISIGAFIAIPIGPVPIVLQNITDSGIDLLGRRCPQLHNVCLSECSRLSDNSLVSLSNCHQLSYVNAVVNLS